MVHECILMLEACVCLNATTLRWLFFFCAAAELLLFQYVPINFMNPQNQNLSKTTIILDLRNFSVEKVFPIMNFKHHFLLMIL